MVDAPFWYQDAGLDWLISKRGKGILFFPPGAGKTRVVADYLTLLARAVDDEVRVLVVCPLSALYTWVRQARQYVTEVPLDVEVITGPVTARWANLAAMARRPKDGPRVLVRIVGLSSFSSVTVRAKDKTPEQQRAAKSATRRQKAFIVRTVDRWGADVLIGDEIHRIKSPTGVGSKLLRDAAPSVPRRIGLTGTLMPQGYEDLFAALDFVEKGMWTQYTGRPSWTAFKERYMLTDPWTHRVTGYRNTDELDRIVAEHVLSISEEEAKGARPPVTLTRVPFELSARERTQYEAMRKQLALEIGTATSVPPSAMTLTLRLRQLASGFVGMDDGTITQTGTSRVDAAYDLVSGTLGDQDRVLVFGEFLHDVHAMADRLRKDKGTEVCQVTGATPVPERESMLARFLDRAQHPGRMVVVAQVATLGESVNELVAAAHGVMLTPMWNRGAWVQALGRLDRTGQTRPVTWWLMEALGTVDGRVYKALEEKGRLEDVVAAECRAEQPGEG